MHRCHQVCGSRQELDAWRHATTGLYALASELNSFWQQVDIHLTNHAGGPQPFSRHDAKQAAKVLPGGCTKGELTLQGQQQALDLGAWLRRRYIEQLGLLPSAAPSGAVAGAPARSTLSFPSWHPEPRAPGPKQ